MGTWRDLRRKKRRRTRKRRDENKTGIFEVKRVVRFCADFESNKKSFTLNQKRMQVVVCVCISRPRRKEMLLRNLGANSASKINFNARSIRDAFQGCFSR